MPNDRRDPETLLETYRAAVQGKDVDAFLALYDPDVRVFDMWGRWSYDGAVAWRGVAANWFGSLGDDRVAVEWDDVRSIAGDDLAVVHAFVTFRGLSAGGAELRAMSNRLTWVLRRSGNGDWTIVHEHTSAPVDVATGTVMMRR